MFEDAFTNRLCPKEGSRTILEHGLLTAEDLTYLFQGRILCQYVVMNMRLGSIPYSRAFAFSKTDYGVLYFDQSCKLLHSMPLAVCLVYPVREYHHYSYRSQAEPESVHRQPPQLGDSFGSM